jgi:hypothetical protein
MNLGLNSVLDLVLDPVNLPQMRHTIVIEAGRRKSRWARRAEQLALSQSGDDGTDQ